jgi:hypothetical protein
MSAIISQTEPEISTPLIDGGLDIQGFENQVNRLPGTENPDSVSGGNLADVLSSFAGNDTIEGLGGNDDIFGGDSNDLLRGGADNDSLDGGTGNDSLEGNDGDDLIISQDGNDTLDGGEGADRIIASGENNILTGGPGEDTFQFDLTEGIPTLINQITDYQIGEKIIVEGNTSTGELSYSQETGKLSLNDQEIAQLPIGTALDLGDVEFIGIDEPNPGATIYRFFNPERGLHFYTASETERDYVKNNLANYQFEGASYTAVDPLTGSTDPVPVYRFYNSKLGVHLYTIDETERDSIIDNLDNYTFEGEAFSAYATQVEGTIPIYRFFSQELGTHFYTPSVGEKDSVEENLPNYKFEGIAYYGYALPEDGNI